MGRPALGALLLFVAACGGSGGEAAPVAAPGGGGPPAIEPFTGPPGARSFKSGPIQVTADGGTIWTANTDNDSVSRLRAADRTVAEFQIPAPAEPTTLSVTGDGREVWVACRASDCVHVLSGGSGAVLATIDLPWGSAPFGIALDPAGARALVTLEGRGAVAEIDVATRSLRRVLEPVWRTPRGIAWTANGREAWLTHLLVEGGEHAKLTRLDASGPAVVVAGSVTAFAADPRQSSRLQAPFAVAEGGYLTFRGHLAPHPDGTEMWLPTQYNNISEDRYTPDSTVQATVRRLRLSDFSLQNTTDGKVILSALHVHEPTGNGAFLGPGWNASASGAVDLAFSADGTTALVVCENSNDLVVLPTDARNVRPAGATPLEEIRVGDQPVGVAVSPVDGGVYVLNRLSRDVSVIDAGKRAEVARIGVTPATGEPFEAAFLRGAKLFHGATDPRASGNGKVACASCHIDAGVDGRSWAFHNLPGKAGPRTTPDLRTLGRTFGPRDPVSGLGRLHASGDRDEVQDFDATFRSGLMGGDGFLPPGADTGLCAPSVARGADLAELSTYPLPLDPLPRSPHRAPDGSLSERAVRGARIFLEAGCAGCHVPETGFSDGRFHDVGQRRPNNEEELNDPARGALRWHVRTRTLLGLWATPPYDGVAGFADDMEQVVDDLAGREGHGDLRGRNGQEKADLAAFLLSIDGDLAADAVRNARDTTPPRLERVEAASLDRVVAWFSEPVDGAAAANAANWQVAETGGGAVPVTAAAWDGRNGDRVTLTVALKKNTAYTVTVGPVPDGAGNAVGAANRLPLALGDTLTITMGASGYETVTIDVHDAGTVGPGLATWSHDAPWLARGNAVQKGFVRFDWRDALAALGVAAATDIVDASFSLAPEFGHRHPIEIRRCLQSWSDPATGGDWNQNPVGGPTWRDHAHPNGRWNQAGAERRATGVEGRNPADYDGPQDTAFGPDAVTQVADVTRRVAFAGPLVTDAFRFWFDNPARDYGYVLQFAPNAPAVGLKFTSHEHGLGRHGPVLTLTVRLP